MEEKNILRFEECETVEELDDVNLVVKAIYIVVGILGAGIILT